MHSNFWLLMHTELKVLYFASVLKMQFSHNVRLLQCQYRRLFHLESRRRSRPPSKSVWTRIDSESLSSLDVSQSDSESEPVSSSLLVLESLFSSQVNDDSSNVTCFDITTVSVSSHPTIIPSVARACALDFGCCT